MPKRKEKPILVRLLNTVCAFTLIGSVIYILITGITLIPSLIILAALGGISGPVFSSSEGILECFAGILEAIFQGIVGVFETIGEIFSSIFG